MKNHFFITFLTLFLVLSACETIKYPACENDADCKSKNKERPNEVCVNRQCVECRESNECSNGYLCKTNVCQPECKTDSDCNSPKICKQEKCEYQCTENGDCDSGYQCEKYICEVKLECTQDIDCNAGLKCQDNRCIEPIKVRKKVELPDCQFEMVHFDYNEFILTKKAREIIEKNVECIKLNPKPIIIEGHCDERGTEEYNLQLGESRAKSVKKYMRSLGVTVDIDVISKGEEEPLERGSNEYSWSKNRRGEIELK